LRAAEFYKDEEQWEECYSHYSKAGDLVQACQVVETVGERYIFSGFYQTVEYWLRTLPEELTSTRPWLLALKGRLGHMAVRHDESLRHLERAFRLFQTEGNQEGQAWVAGEIAYVRQRAGHLQQALRHLSSGLALAADGSALKSELLVMQSQAYRDAGMLGKSVEAGMAGLEQLTDVVDDPRRLRCQSRADRNLAVTHMEMGDLESARRGARETLAFCLAHQIGEYEESWCLAMLGAILWASGDFEESIQVLNRALSLSSRHTKHLQHFLGLWLGNAYRDTGKPEDAQRAYSLSMGAADLECAFMSVLGRRGNGMLEEVTELHRQHHHSESIPVRTSAEMLLSVALRESRDNAPALEHAREAVKYLAAGGYRLRLASALLHQARLEYDLTRSLEGRKTLTQAFQIASEGEYYHFFWWDSDTVAFLCQRAMAEGICVPYAADLATRRLDSSTASFMAPLLSDRRAEVRQRAMTVLSSLPERGTNSLRNQILADCTDSRVRTNILQVIGDGLVSAQGAQSLRTKFGLSWRELEVFIEYYLRPSAQGIPSSPTLRTECAERLSISESTVRCHINNIRGKLGLPTWISGERVIAWAEQEGLLPSSHAIRETTLIPPLAP
jgi:tetratricopeptide (TPR) repeat protein